METQNIIPLSDIINALVFRLSCSCSSLSFRLVKNAEDIVFYFGEIKNVFADLVT